MMIALAVITGFIALAKRGRGKRRAPRDWTKIPVDETESLSTLADNTALIQALITSALTHDYRCTSIKVQWSLANLTAGEGPIQVGVAHGDYSLAEIEEFLEQDAPTGPNSLVEREVAGRLIRRVGVFSGVAAEEVLNDGKPIRTRLNWLIADGQRINSWVYNNSGASLTTGALVRTFGECNGFWT